MFIYLFIYFYLNKVVTYKGYNSVPKTRIKSTIFFFLRFTVYCRHLRNFGMFLLIDCTSRHDMSHEKIPGCLGYIGDYTTQLYGDYFINHEIRIPINHPV